MTKLISRYRSQIMGIAALLVVLTHCGLQSSNFVIHSLCYYGYLGVDLFLFLSGFGLYHALYKKPKLTAFFSRRMLRIYPSLIPMLILWILDLLHDGLIQGWKQVLYVFSGHILGYMHYIQPDESLWYNWYILALPLFYLSAPVIALVIRKYRGLGWLLMTGVSLAVLPLFFGSSLQLRLFSRMPVYILGFWFGYLDIRNQYNRNDSGFSLISDRKSADSLSSREQSLQPLSASPAASTMTAAADRTKKTGSDILNSSRKPASLLSGSHEPAAKPASTLSGSALWSLSIHSLLWISLFIAILSLMIAFCDHFYDISYYYGLWWWPFFPAAPGACLLIAWICRLFEKIHINLELLVWLGAASFEIYLVHLEIFRHLDKLGNLSSIQWLFAILFSTALGVVYHKLIERLVSTSTRLRQSRK